MAQADQISTVHQATTAHLVHLVLMVQISMVHPVLMDHQAHQVLQVQISMAHQVLMVPTVLPAHQVQMALPAQISTVQTVLLDLMALTVLVQTLKAVLMALTVSMAHHHLLTAHHTHVTVVQEVQEAHAERLATSVLMKKSFSAVVAATCVHNAPVKSKSLTSRAS